MLLLINSLYYLQFSDYSLIGLKAPLSKKEIMSCTGNLANYLGLVMSKILEENLQPPLN